MTFPVTVRCKSSIATIYRSTNRGKDAYTVCFYNAEGVRQRRMFRAYETTKETAEAAVAGLSDGGSDSLTLRGRERYAYELAMETLRPLGLTLDSVVSQAVEAIGILNGSGSLLEAAKQFVSEHSARLPMKTVRETVAELVAEKERAGPSELHVKDLRLRLGRFADAFRCPISSLTAPEIHQFLLALKVGFRTRRNYRQAIGTLLNFAKARGYLPSDHPGVSKVPKEPKRGRRISVFSPSELTALLCGAKPALLPALALGAFAGLRSEELKRLQWSHLKLARNLLGHREPASERMWEKVYPRVIPLLQRVGMKSRLGLPGLSRTERRRWQAVTALMKLRESGVDLKPLLPQMKVLVQDQDSEVRRAARFMLREIDSEALDQLDTAGSGANLTGRTQP